MMKQSIASVRELGRLADEGMIPKDLQVVLMEVFALIPLFAQTTQPVFADKTVEGMVHLMFVRAVGAQRAVAFPKSFAYWAAGI